MKEDPRVIWERYTSTWSEKSTAARLAAYRECLNEQCVYTDPNVRAAGYQELAAYMDAFQEQLPGGAFVTRTFSTHHASVLVAWDMRDAGGNTVGVGTSFGTLGPDGRLTSMTGFFEQAQ